MFEINASQPLRVIGGDYLTYGLPPGLVAFHNFIKLPMINR